jgi:hypothetical protein
MCAQHCHRLGQECEEKKRSSFNHHRKFCSLRHYPSLNMLKTAYRNSCAEKLVVIDTGFLSARAVDYERDEEG